MSDQTKVQLEVTFLAATVEVVGQQLRGNKLGHLVEPHQTANFQLLWPEGHIDRID